MVEVFSFGGRPAIAVRVSPGASRTRIQGEMGGKLKVSVAAPPEGGRANASVVSVLAAALGVDQAAVDVVAGRASRDKVIAFSGVDEAGLRARLSLALGEAGARR